MLRLIAHLDALAEDVQAAYPEVAELIDEAASMLTASDERIAADVDALASVLRDQLPGLNPDDSVTVATGLIQQYGPIIDLDERDALGVPLLPSPTHLNGPNPEKGMYAPGTTDWWKTQADSEDEETPAETETEQEAT